MTSRDRRLYLSFMLGIASLLTGTLLLTSADPSMVAPAQAVVQDDAATR